MPRIDPFPPPASLASHRVVVVPWCAETPVAAGGRAGGWRIGYQGRPRRSTPSTPCWRVSRAC